MERKKALLFLCLIVLLGGFLRFYGLSKQSLWYDELETWRIINTDSLSGVFDTIHKYETMPPGYLVSMYFVKKFAGDSEAALRFPSAIGGTLALVAIFLLGARLYSYKEGLIAAAFMALPWAPIHYSQEARPYSLLILFVILSTYFWAPLIKEPGNKRFPYGYIICSAAAAYLHYFGFFLIILQGFGLLAVNIYRKKNIRFTLFVYAVFIAVYLPCIPELLYQYDNKLGRLFFIAPPSSLSIVKYFEHIFLWRAEGLLLVFLLFSFYFSKTAYSLASRGSKGLSSDLILISWLVLPLGIIYIKSTTSFYSLWLERYLTISMPAAYLILARSFAILPVSPRKLFVAVVVLMGGVLLWLYHDVQYFHPQYSKGTWRQATQYIIDREPEYRDTLVLGYCWHNSVFRYYFDRKGSSVRVAGPENDFELSPEYYKTVIERENPLFVWLMANEALPGKSFLDGMSQNMSCLDHKVIASPVGWNSPVHLWLFNRALKEGD